MSVQRIKINVNATSVFDIVYNVAKYIISPDDELLLEFVDNFTYWQLAKNEEFVARVKQRLIEKDEIHKRRKVIS